MTLIDSLKSLTLFNGLTSNSLYKLTKIAIKKSFEANRTLFSEGESAHGFHVIVSGRVKVFKISAQGRTQILHFMGPNHPVGEVAVFRNIDYPAFAEAVEDSTTIYFPKQAFFHLIQEHPSVALEMLAILSQRLQHFTQLIEDLSLKEVPARLARYFLQLHSESQTATVTLSISKFHLAALLGTSPETLSRSLARMAQQGYIKPAGKSIEILDRDALSDLSLSGRMM